MPLQKPKTPEELSDAELRKRLAATAENPARLDKWVRLGVQAAAIVGIIAAVFAANALGLGDVGEIALVLALGGGIAMTSGLSNYQQAKWDVEHERLRAEAHERPRRMRVLAHSLKEKFIAAITNGTEDKITVKPPLKLKTPGGADGPKP